FILVSVFSEFFLPLMRCNFTKFAFSSAGHSRLLGSLALKMNPVQLGRFVLIVLAKMAKKSSLQGMAKRVRRARRKIVLTAGTTKSSVRSGRRRGRS
ncbi:MAG: hypothetical protein FWH35_07895, partial [Treponema sp.]|nr:hypothetical protein [Treponema sp.]